MVFKGRKLKKEEYRVKLAKRIAMKGRVNASEVHYNRADQLIKDGAYDEYVASFKKKSAKKSEE